MIENGIKPNYEALSDEQLVSLTHGGDKEAERLLVVRFMPLVRTKIRPYFLVGADDSDLAQEGAIGLCGAIRDYDETRGASFRSYADVCITNNVIAAIKKATRKKHSPLNSYVSLDMPLSEEEGAETLADRLNSVYLSPEDMAIGRQEERALVQAMEKSLSELEKTVLSLFLQGKSYKLISEKTGRSEKAVDNALQRIKKKVAALIKKDDL